ncbi:MAG: MmcQ/YjbR family DNA-binding protein [Ignavibacteriae bacterium]|nr:MmcQ/YjbR family DNA-binding protein [Ignavibacteriota bacterium]
MRIDTVRNYCLSKPGVEETFPFDETTLVFKVAGKMFLLAALENVPLTINIKCDPARAVELREQYEEVQPGYHMNKKNWNTVTLDGAITDRTIREWIDDSYALVVSGLPKKLQAELALAAGKK